MSLHHQFISIAKEKNKLTYKLLQLLPQIYVSREYKKYARTIEGYAMQFAQIPESTVRKTLKLEKHLKDKPALKSLIPKVGIHKISLIATLASPETDKIYAEKAASMSVASLQSLSKEVRGGPKINKVVLELNQDQLGLLKLVKKKLGLDLSNEELIEKLCMEFLDDKKVIIDHEKKQQKLASRHIPNKIRKKVLAEYNHMCAYPNCENKAKEIHHKIHFAASRNHENLVPLCSEHHQFMHHNLIENQEKEPHYWKLHLEPTTNRLDLKYQKMRC